MFDNVNNNRHRCTFCGRIWCDSDGGCGCDGEHTWYLLTQYAGVKLNMPIPETIEIRRCKLYDRNTCAICKDQIEIPSFKVFICTAHIDNKCDDCTKATVHIFDEYKIEDKKDGE